MIDAPSKDRYFHKLSGTYTPEMLFMIMMMMTMLRMMRRMTMMMMMMMMMMVTNTEQKLHQKSSPPPPKTPPKSTKNRPQNEAKSHFYAKRITAPFPHPSGPRKCSPVHPQEEPRMSSRPSKNR